MVRYRVLVTGRAGGASFRVACRGMALQHDVRGWVSSLPDGVIEAVFEGSAENVQHMLDWVRGGPHQAAMADVFVQAEEPEGLPGPFQIRHGQLAWPETPPKGPWIAPPGVAGRRTLDDWINDSNTIVDPGNRRCGGTSGRSRSSCARSPICARSTPGSRRSIR